jgi:hypothetical protein
VLRVACALLIFLRSARSSASTSSLARSAGSALRSAGALSLGSASRASTASSLRCSRGTRSSLTCSVVVVAMWRWRVDAVAALVDVEGEDEEGEDEEGEEKGEEEEEEEEEEE